MGGKVARDARTPLDAAAINIDVENLADDVSSNRQNSLSHRIHRQQDHPNQTRFFPSVFA
jgi:hypothetical protein